MYVEMLPVVIFLGVLRVLYFGIERDTPFLIMAYAPNGTLRQPKGTRLPIDTVVSYIQQIAEALQHKIPTANLAGKHRRKGLFCVRV
jgi:hypothetical protein